MSKINITIICLIISTHLSANRTEFQIYGGAGFPITLQNGISTSSFDGNAGLGLTAFVTRNVGIHLGVGLGVMHRETTVDKLKTVTYGLIDANNYTYDLHSTFSDYCENVRVKNYFTMPLMLYIQPDTEGFYTKAGIKLFLPIGDSRVNCDVSVATLQNEGYYVEHDNWAKTQLFAGFGTFSDNHTSSDFAFQFSTALALEVGWKWYLNQNMFLYTGLFLDYWLNDFTKDYRQTPSDFSRPENLVPATMVDLGLFQHDYKINPATVGIKLRLAFTCSDKQRANARHKLLLLCPPTQMREQRPWDRPSLVFNHPAER